MNKILISCFYPVIVHYSAYQAHSSIANSSSRGRWKGKTDYYTALHQIVLLTCRLCCLRGSCRGRRSLRGCQVLCHMLAPAQVLAGAARMEKPLQVLRVRLGTCSLLPWELLLAHRTHSAQSRSSSYLLLVLSAPTLKNSPMITALCPRVPLTLDPMNWRAVTKVTVKSHLSGVTIANCRTPHYPRPPIAGNWPLKSVKLVSPTSAADVGSAPQRLRSKLLNIDGGLSKQ